MGVGFAAAYVEEALHTGGVHLLLPIVFSRYDRCEGEWDSMSGYLISQHDMPCRSCYVGSGVMLHHRDMPGVRFDFGARVKMAKEHSKEVPRKKSALYGDSGKHLFHFLALL